jgi:aspartate/tyrosine/aromatic aminotransferase
VAGDLLARVAPKATVWLSEPTWANHPQIFAAAGVPTKTYPYLDRGQNRLAFERTLEAIEAIPPGDVLLLHGCCHNPTGVDPTDEQWRAIGQIVNRRGLLPLVDLAYQGFGQGLDEDVRGLRHLWQQGTEMIVCSSYSKNFSLYNERVGAMTLVAGTSDSAEAAFSHAKRCIRANYSNPPAHGAALVHTILAQPELKAMWLEELTQMRQRIAGNRRRLVESLKQQGVNDIDFIAQQQGMFTLLNLNAEQIKTLREQHAIYVVGSGRINVAGLSSEQIPLLARALADVWVNAGSSAGA